jgi:DUF4097 and DUF4098 domain-containing protein YvlB
VRIVNTNGRVEVAGVEGSTVQVRAEKVARAATEEAARELLPRIKISEDAGTDRIVVETERMGGFLLGAGFEVRYDVKVPRYAVVEVTSTNGPVTVTNVTGSVNAHTTNGAVRATNLRGGLDARSTNGSVNAEMAVVADRLWLQTTNGDIRLTMPAGARADISASWTNGGISLSDLKLDETERSSRRFEGRMNGGGTPIELHTTNGRIRLRNGETGTENAEPSAR